jgi:pyruvate dehydrogenase E1 component
MFRDLLELPIPDDKLVEAPYYHPGAKAPEVQYMLERRRQLGGSVPRRRVTPVALALPDDKIFAEFREGTKADMQASTTMVFGRMIRGLMKDASIGRRIVPIIPDEARTFGMEPLFTEFGIYAAEGQKYTPVDANYLLKYHEAEDGQILEEGITEAGAMADFIAAATSYAHRGEPMIPFFIFYSMFGFQRVGDLIWSCADSRGRGFLLGATAGRTTLMGEGLQHDDGQSPILASVVPSVRTYDPAFAYEVAILIQDGIRRMYGEGEDIVYYLTLYNDNYSQPPMPKDVEAGVTRGLYRFRAAAADSKLRVRLLGSGPILLEVLRAQEILADEFGVAAEVWSATSYGELRRDGLECRRWNRLHPGKKTRVPYVSECLTGDASPIVAATDYVTSLPEMIAPWAGPDFDVLGTDGFGRSDTRQRLRRFFEIDAAHVVIAALAALVRRGEMKPSVVTKAMKDFGIDPEAPNPGAADYPGLKQTGLSAADRPEATAEREAKPAPTS